MKKNYKKILLLVFCLFILTGCTKILKDKDNKAVRNEETGQAITENIICRPTNPTTIEIYEENDIDIKSLPKCKNFTPLKNYEGLWTSLFVKPLAWLIIKIGTLLKNYGLAIIIVTCVISPSWFIAMSVLYLVAAVLLIPICISKKKKRLKRNIA